MTDHRETRPAAGEFAPFYARYIAAVPDGDLVERLRIEGAAIATLLRSLDRETAGHRYAPGKWSVLEVFGHLIDSERVFAYRALRFGRGDTTPLAGFDENLFAVEAGHDGRTPTDLAAELEAVRAATIALFASLAPAAWERRGEANGQPVSVRALGWMTAGHELHHRRILRERYGVGS